MVTLFVRHGVGDYDKWKAGYDGAADLRNNNGVLEDAVYRDIENSAVIATHKFADLNGARAYMQLLGSDEVAQMLQELSVQPPITSWIGEDV